MSVRPSVRPFVIDAWLNGWSNWCEILHTNLLNSRGGLRQTSGRKLLSVIGIGVQKPCKNTVFAVLTRKEGSTAKITFTNFFHLIDMRKICSDDFCNCRAKTCKKRTKTSFCTLFARFCTTTTKTVIAFFAHVNYMKLFCRGHFVCWPLFRGQKLKKCGFSRFLHVFARQSQKLSEHIFCIKIRQNYFVKVIFPIDPSFQVKTAKNRFLLSPQGESFTYLLYYKFVCHKWVFYGYNYYD